MSEFLFTYLIIAFGAFGWGMLINEWIIKRRAIKARDHRIVIDAPFSPDQSETIMRVLQELNEAVRKSTETKTNESAAV